MADDDDYEDYEDISDGEKLAIVKYFVTHTPPGTNLLSFSLDGFSSPVAGRAAPASPVV